MGYDAASGIWQNRKEDHRPNLYNTITRKMNMNSALQYVHLNKHLIPPNRHEMSFGTKINYLVVVYYRMLPFYTRIGLIFKNDLTSYSMSKIEYMVKSNVVQGCRARIEKFY